MKNYRNIYSRLIELCRLTTEQGTLSGTRNVALPGINSCLFSYKNIIVYSTSNQENTVNQLLYPGFVDEIVDAIRLNDTSSKYAVGFQLVIFFN